MQVVHHKDEVRQLARGARATGKTLALVPTMGALHPGHLQLVVEASQQADHVTVSIFVNPTQFGEDEDFDRYPRDLEADLAKLEGLPIDVVFAPSSSEMYPAGASTIVRVEGADQHLCGRFRPGHFEGVTTIVSKLFACCEPDRALFGLKDGQQYLILTKMARDLGLGVEVVGAQTVREDDGLAMSSRNVYLNSDERLQAVVVSRSVFEARRLIEAGEAEPDAIRDAMLRTLSSSRLAEVQYAEVVDTETIAPVAQIVSGRRYLAAVAVFFGNTRLIDNQFIDAP